jgi:predicted phosphodiesterase
MRIAVLSDVHSNLRALEAVLADIGAADAFWHLGDAVGYGPDPDAVVARLRDLGAISVRGNHDDAVAGGECIRWFVADSRAAVEWSRARVSPDTLAYLAALPPQLVLETPAGSFTLVHGSPRDPLREYVYSRAVAREVAVDLRTRHCFIGHSHIPLHFQEMRGRDPSMEEWQVTLGRPIELGEGRAILNPGGVGQPRDGDPRAAYMILDTDLGEAVWQRVEYDVEGTQRAMLEAGLPPALAYRLSLGR